MRIAVSLLNLRPGRIGGAETYLRQLIAHAPKVSESDTIILLLTKGNATTISAPEMERIVSHRSDRQMVLARILEAFTPYRARFAEKALAQVAPDVVLFPQQSLFPKHVNVPSVLVVHDLQHLLFPELFSRFDRAFRASIYEYSLRRADRIIAISEFTRKTLIERYGLPPKQIAVVPHGLSPMDINSVRPYDRIHGRYLYYPGATYPHKGHDILLETFAQLRQRGNFDYKLVLTGQRTPHWRTLRKQIKRLRLASAVTHLGFLPYDEVLQVFKGAEAILFPTRFEGFGLPVLEAVQYRRKVIVSRLEVFDEIGVPRRLQIDFADPEQLLGALRLPGPTDLEKEPWTWADTARGTLDVLRMEAKRRDRRPERPASLP